MTCRRILDQTVGQPLGNLGGEEAGMRIGDDVELLMEGRDHVWMAVPEAGHRRTAGSVDVAPSVSVEQFDTFAVDGDRHGGIGGTVEDVRHDNLLTCRDFRCVLSAARCSSV